MYELLNNDKYSLAGFRANSEIIGKFRRLKKFYGHFVKRHGESARFTELLPIFEIKTHLCKKDIPIFNPEIKPFNNAYFSFTKFYLDFTAQCFMLYRNRIAR